MGYNINPQELRFLQQIAENEEVAPICHLLRAIATGVDLPSDDILSIEDYLMDRTAELDSEDIEVPGFFDAIRSIVAKVVNSTPSQAQDQFGQSSIPGMPGMGPQANSAPKKVRKPRTPKSDAAEPRTSKKEKYKESEITAENIPQYLLDINNIINMVVDARCQEEIERRITAEKKLEQLQKILGGL